MIAENIRPIDTAHQGSRHGSFELAAATVNLISTWILAGIARRRQRRALADLDDRLLRDVGLSRDQADHEATKPFWHM